ncbi:MAG: DNA polymerase III subunit epsilon [Holosporaceae bacterium]|jgi:DNA polymerase-3 subunit epsilon|nr:DNA polymerase III subunit epsilon [Holosporaceae bacterium]
MHERSLKNMNISRCIREIVLDTETTGLDSENGDRIVDIACVELINHVPTGNTYQVYINPEREMPPEAIAITGITDEMLVGKPLFHEIADDFLNFIKDSTLVIHNAKFDIKFLNCELARISKPLLNLEDAIDTLQIVRQKFPGTPGNLDFLCKKFEIDASERTKHGALIDCKLLAEVYINLLGGRQSSLSFENENKDSQSNVTVQEKRKKYARRFFPPADDEILAHQEFLKKIPSSLWSK